MRGRVARSTIPSAANRQVDYLRNILFCFELSDIVVSPDVLYKRFHLGNVFSYLSFDLSNSELPTSPQIASLLPFLEHKMQA
jgi:hypothetical protein